MFSLSLRDVELILAERGIAVTHESIRQWGLKFGGDFAAKLRQRRPRPGDTWHLDEVLILSAKSPARPSARIAAGNLAGVITWNRTSPAKCLRATQPQRTWPGLLWRLPDFADSINVRHCRRNQAA